MIRVFEEVQALVKVTEIQFVYHSARVAAY